MERPPNLIAGPYKTPRIKPGVDVPGVVLGRGGVVDGPHVVRGLTDAPIAWPWTIAGGGSRRQLIVFGDLEKAIRTESVQAVAYWWGISRWWVERARRCLEVPRMNEGTTQLWRDLAKTRLASARAPTRLDDAQIAEIRKRAAAGESGAVLTKEFSITRQYLSLLLRGERRRRK